jgi:hypothetical protein
MMRDHGNSGSSLGHNSESSSAQEAVGSESDTSGAVLGEGDATSTVVPEHRVGCQTASQRTPRENDGLNTESRLI